MVSIFRRKNLKKFVFQCSGNLPVQKNIQNQYIKNQIILIENKKYHVSISDNKTNSKFNSRNSQLIYGYKRSHLSTNQSNQVSQNILFKSREFQIINSDIYILVMKNNLIE